MVGAYAALIFWLSSLSKPFPAFEGFQKFHADKIFHVLEYGFFGALLVRALWLSVVFPSLGVLFLAAWLGGSLYGLSDEWHQRCVPGRESTAADALTDSMGVGMGVYLWMRKNRMFAPCLK